MELHFTGTVVSNIKVGTKHTSQKYCAIALIFYVQTQILELHFLSIILFGGDRSIQRRMYVVKTEFISYFVLVLWQFSAHAPEA